MPTPRRNLHRTLLLSCNLLLLVTGAAAAANSCLVVRDAASAQDVRIEAHGANAVRVRSVPSGGSFFDPPDVVSALLGPSSLSTADCP